MNDLIKSLKDALSVAKTAQDLDNIKSKYLGKKSEIKAKFDEMKNAAAAARQKLGAELNAVREQMESLLDNAKAQLARHVIEEKLANDAFDMTLPGAGQPTGALHPVTEVEQRCINAMRRLGFSVVTGPEIELPEYNFDLLDIPEHHPARDMQDTFWIKDTVSPPPAGGPAAPGGAPGGGKKCEAFLLRTHTTSVQSRFMMSLKGDESKLPIRIVVPGRVYRNEAVDAT
ncbi:MAG: phenylalanine--tRNA ligase subunit alpha, partial [Proteobacteria bacterium]|nr:phenylalanine--tRNA ligase subunit alpha [Pseudomonadota bacterium]